MPMRGPYIRLSLRVLVWNRLTSGFLGEVSFPMVVISLARDLPEIHPYRVENLILQREQLLF